MNNYTASQYLADQCNDPAFATKLMNTSASEEDAYSRLRAYSMAMSNQDEMNEITKSFSGYSEMPLLGVQQMNATLAGYVRSAAGFLAIERGMDNPTTILWYNDILGVTDNRKIMPNVGLDNLKGINGKFQTNSPFTVGQKKYTISTNKKLIPGSVELKFHHATDALHPIHVKDDRNGNLLAPAGILASNDKGEVSVNYLTGLITFTVGDGFKIETNDSFIVIGQEDVAGDPTFGQLTGPGNNRIKLDNKHIIATAIPDMLVAEHDLMTQAAAKKSLGMDPAQVAAAKLTELYTKLINNKLVDGLIENVQGDTVEIDMVNYIQRFTDYNSRLDAMQSDLVDIDTAFATRTSKATKATAYVVGTETGNYFRKLRSTGNWVDNTDSTYVNDLLGHLNGIPVFRHMNVAPEDGYAVHKTPGGELAPLMRGIYLPLTTTPKVGNYNNPTQMAEGIYYQECNEVIVPELIQKFTLKLPAKN